MGNFFLYLYKWKNGTLLITSRCPTLLGMWENHGYGFSGSVPRVDILFSTWKSTTWKRRGPPNLEFPSWLQVSKLNFGGCRFLVRICLANLGFRLFSTCPSDHGKSSHVDLSTWCHPARLCLENAGSRRIACGDTVDKCYGFFTVLAV